MHSIILHDGGLTSEYPEFSVDSLAEALATCGKPLRLVRCQQAGGMLKAIAQATELAVQLARDASRERRRPCPPSALSLGLKCGWSDPTSGIAGNPVVGALFDRLIDAGGTALFGETVEVIGAEHILARRFASPQEGQRLLERVAAVEEAAIASGVDVRKINPVAANLAAGITSLEEKSLGAIYKSGQRTISAVLDFAERPERPGLYFVDNSPMPASTYTGYAAAGAQLGIWQLGGGGIPNLSLLPPSPVDLMPLFWLTANPQTAARCFVSVDFDSSAALRGDQSVEHVAEQLWQTLLEVASGTATLSETLKHSDPAAIYSLERIF